LLALPYRKQNLGERMPVACFPLRWNGESR